MRLLQGLLAATLLGGTAVVVAHSWLGVGGAEFDAIASGPLYDSVVIAAGLACLLRARIVRRERAAWLMIGSGILCWAAGEVYWTLYILDNPAAPYPSPADVAYLAFYPLTYAGLALLVRARSHELDWRLWADGAIATIGTAALGTAFIFDFVADRTSGTTLEVATSLAYPLGDIAMLSMVVGVIAMTGWRPGRTWSLLLAGLTMQVVADIAYTVQATNGFIPSGNWIDPLYLVSACFLGALLWQPSAGIVHPGGSKESRSELMVPAVFAALMIGLAAMQYLEGASGLSTVLWAAAMAAVVGRLAVSVRENGRLLEQVQTDPLTKLGNRGRMQLDLETLASRATTENPISLVFLDLNGFKRYNDTLGHPAGDALLVRLGEALRDALGEDGAAYRVGGDEFCILLTCDPERFEPTIQRAEEALSESDRGVEVDASFGSAVIPDEATDPSEALRLADVRMYAKKESRRVAPIEGEPAKVSPWPQPTSAAR
jgi:diguanylate cyclase (GGDEF)-like protein